MKITKNLKVIIGIFVGLLVIFVIVMLTRPTLQNLDTSNQQASGKIQIKDSQGRTATISRDGFVYYTDENGRERKLSWDTDKVSSFFEYFELNLKGVDDQVLANDELVVNVLDELSGTDGNDDEGSSGGLSDLFSTPTPPGDGSGDSDESDEDVSNGSDGTGGSGDSDGSTPPPPAPSWCKHWKLSYCADPVYPSPSPTPSMSFPPEVIQAKDCDEWNAQVDTKTVISNFSCSEEGQ